VEQVNVFVGNERVPNGTYNDKAGKVTSYVDLSLISPQAVKTADIRKQAQAGVTAGNRAQKARVVEHNFERLLKQAELCDDNGR
jgi:hypothetical protein